MTDLAERTIGLDVVDKATPSSTPGQAPPAGRPRATPHVTPPWPPRAKLWVAVLLVAAVLGAVGTVIGFTSGDDTATTPTELEATIDALTTERADLVAQTNDLQATIDTLTAERDGLVAQISDLDATIETTADQRDGLAIELAGVEATLTNRTVQRDALVRRIAIVETDLVDQTQRTSTVVAERDALATLFPIDFDASLVGVDLVGTYDVDLTRAYCEGFATCATLPPVDEFAIRATPEGWLELVIDDFVTAGLYRVDGALYAIADSTTAVAACAGTARVARVAVTMYANGLTVADDGTTQVTDLGASLTLQAPATSTCPAGLAFYGAQVTPQS
jgi:uncharacterized protein YoxC